MPTQKSSCCDSQGMRKSGISLKNWPMMPEGGAYVVEARLQVAIYCYVMHGPYDRSESIGSIRTCLDAIYSATYRIDRCLRQSILIITFHFHRIELPLPKRPPSTLSFS